MQPKVQIAATGIEALEGQLGPPFKWLLHSGVAVAVVDRGAPDLPILFVNAAFEELSGYSNAEIAGRGLEVLGCAETDEADMRRIAAAMAAGTPATVEVRHRRKSDDRFWDRVHVAPLADTRERHAYAVATFADVSVERERAAVAAELAAAKEQVRLTLAMAGTVGAWEWDVQNRMLYGDARFSELYGLDRRAAIAGLPTNTFFAAIHNEDRLRLRIAVAGMLHGADQFTREFRLLRADGTIRWVSARAASERDGDDRTVRLKGVLTDITEERRVKDQLRIVQSAGGIGTFEYVSGFGTVAVSDQFCRLLGFVPTDSLPVRTVNFVVHPDDPPLIGGPTAGAEADSYREFRIERADGGGPRWIAQRGEHKLDGTVFGDRFVGVIYDITAAKTAENRLRDLTATLEERVRERTKERDRVWRNSRDLLVIAEADGRLRAVSPAWTMLLGHGAEAVLHRRWLDFVAAQDQAATGAALARANAGEELINFEHRMVAADGGERWISWNTKTEAGLVYGYGRDITDEKNRAEELRQAEEALRQSQKMEAVGQLTGGIAHDFNNMLTGIMAGLEITRRRIATGRVAEADRYLDVAMTSAERAANLVHRLLAFSRRQSLKPSAVDVNDLVRSMEDLLRRTLGEQIELEIALDGQASAAFIDVSQLESAILNLVINARDAMPDGGRLSIATANVTLHEAAAEQWKHVKAGRYVVVSVTDTGHGMSEDVLAKVFEPFFTTKPLGQGTGLGLSMIYGFVRQIGGHIDIRSAPQAGTTVSLFLPPYNGQGNSSAETIVERAPSGEGEVVLVVEDDQSVRLMVLEVLHELAYQAIEAADGRRALEILDSDARIDLVITDVGLPGVNGRQLAEIARERRPHLRVLFMTGYAAIAGLRSDFLLPGMDMINKPFALEALGSKVRQMLASEQPGG